MIELRVHAQRVVHAGPLLEQLRQNFIDFIDGMSLIGPVLAARALGSGSAALPRLPGRIPGTDEQHVLPLFAAGHQDCDGIRLAKTGEVVKIAVLAVRILHITVAMAHRSRREDRDALASHHAHELPPATCELLSPPGYHVNPPQCSSGPAGER
jgi:hypothetical protein